MLNDNKNNNDEGKVLTSKVEADYNEYINSICNGDSVNEQNNSDQGEAKNIKKNTKNHIFLKIAIPSCVGLIAIAVIIAIALTPKNQLPTDDPINSNNIIIDSVDTDKILNSDYEIPVDIATDLDISDVDIKNVNIPFINGIKVGGLDLSGMTYDNAYQYVESNKLKFVDKRNYEITCDGKKYNITEEDFTYETNALEQLEKAYALSTNIYNKEASDIDTDVLPEDILKDLSTDKDFPVEYTLNLESVSSAVSNFAKKVNKSVLELKLESFNPNAKKGKQFKFSKGRAGKEVDKDEIINSITAFINDKKLSGSLSCQTKVIEPTLNPKDVQSKMQLLASYSTISTNGYNGNHNMKISMEAANGTLLFKGDVFSFNGATGNSNLQSNGYLPAGVIANGQLTTGVGGGICQSATTIYNAGVRSGLTIIERGPHLWASAYVPVGMDAVIDYGNLDLKMRNDQKTPVYFYCYMSGATLTCKIYGVQPDWYDKITCKSWVTDINYGVGYSASACRIYWKNDKKVKTEALKSSYYSLSQGYVRSDYDEYQEYLDELNKPKPSTDTDKPKPSTDTDKPKPSTDTEKPNPSTDTENTPQISDTDELVFTDTEIFTDTDDIYFTDSEEHTDSELSTDTDLEINSIEDNSDAEFNNGTVD